MPIVFEYGCTQSSKGGDLFMNSALLSAQDYHRKVSTLRMASNAEVDIRQVAIKRAVLETLRDPVVARAVARSLRPHTPDKD